MAIPSRPALTAGRERKKSRNGHAGCSGPIAAAARKDSIVVIVNIRVSLDRPVIYTPALPGSQGGNHFSV